MAVSFVIEDSLVTPAVTGDGVDFGVTVTLSARASFTGTKRRTVLCTQEAAPYASGFLENAVHGPVTWEPSQPTSASYSLPSTDPKIKAVAAPGRGGIDEPYREAILYYGDRVLTWGPCIAPRLTGDRFDVQVKDHLWEVGKRHIGFAQAQNECINGDFRGGLSGWTVNAVNIKTREFFAQDATIYAEVARHPVLSSWRTRVDALHLHNEHGKPPDSYDALFARQERGFTATGYPRQIVISADVYVENMTDPNLFKCGIVLAAYPHGYTSIFDNFTPVAMSTIDERYPVGPESEIQRHTFPITIPPATTGVCQWKLFALGAGDIWFSDVQVVYDSAFVFNEDQGDIAFKLMDHLTGNVRSPFVLGVENPNFPYSTNGFGKSDLLIDVESVPTGVIRQKKWSMQGGHNGLQSLQELSGLTDGVEFWMDYHPDADERRRVMRVQAPYQGYVRLDLPLRWGGSHGGNLTDFAWSMQGEQGANAVIVRAHSGGVAAPAGSWITDSDFADGLTLEQVIQAPREAQPVTLNNRAMRRQTVTARPISLAVKLPAADYMQKGLMVGDRLPVNIRHGQFALDEIMWVRRMTLTPDDYLELVMQIGNL